MMGRVGERQGQLGYVNTYFRVIKYFLIEKNISVAKSEFATKRRVLGQKMGGNSSETGIKSSEKQTLDTVVAVAWSINWQNTFEMHISIIFRPGKLNNSYWENRVKADHGLEMLPPKTPPPKRRLMDVSVVNNGRWEATIPIVWSDIRTIYIPNMTQYCRSSSRGSAQDSSSEGSAQSSQHNIPLTVGEQEQRKECVHEDNNR